MGRVYKYLLSVMRDKGAGYLVLLDPDRLDPRKVKDVGMACQEGGADALLVGSSLLLGDTLDRVVWDLKEVVDVPVILFPGSSDQLSAGADAVLFLSLVSGRNPELLIGQQVRAAPKIRAFGLEPISTAYILVEGGALTTVEYMSNTRPIPRDKVDVAMAHALAAEYLGMRMVYLEAGSGARFSVPEEMVRGVAGYVGLPVIVGGGIRDPKVARRKVEAGASFVVTGNVLEDGRLTPERVRAFADAVHLGGR
ncbi:MAG: geranylgeranylglyceryl/heptaprenylglyceryl phosphate synthase [Candidatus Latescibacterota bacterium]|nr:MAG: geranylgeranylglyceryl/heptaprenylglyceryl phosphate synthase [Candidatus Latescibacterota bacterium]